MFWFCSQIYTLKYWKIHHLFIQWVCTQYVLHARYDARHWKPVRDRLAWSLPSAEIPSIRGNRVSCSSLEADTAPSQNELSLLLSLLCRFYPKVHVTVLGLKQIVQTVLGFLLAQIKHTSSSLPGRVKQRTCGQSQSGYSEPSQSMTETWDLCLLRYTVTILNLKWPSN